MTTLGRGGSDLTATALGKALGLREIQVGTVHWRFRPIAIRYRSEEKPRLFLLQCVHGFAY